MRSFANGRETQIEGGLAATCFRYAMSSDCSIQHYLSVDTFRPVLMPITGAAAPFSGRDVEGFGKARRRTLFQATTGTVRSGRSLV